ncbi:MAG: hypothetical protein EXQ69_05685 [Acidimicrobiia bacterium]|nr:hypothetical protein [Acidimicrobiia bacterium]
MNIGDVLLDILVVLVAAKIAAEVAERIRIPAVVGEIVAGVLVGPSVLALVGSSEVLLVLGELGVILLLLQVGLEMDVKGLAAVGRASMSVATIGVVLPMLGGFAVGMAFGEVANVSLFLGAALAATSVGLTARVFSDLRALSSIEARTVLGAAIADDVLGLVILTVVVRIVADGSVSLLAVAGIVAVAAGFLIVTVTIGGRLGPPLFRFVQQHSRSAGTLVTIALAFTLAFAQLASVARLAPIVGAFVAGLALSRSDQKERIERELAPVGHLFIPVFFLGIGIAVDVGAFFDGQVLAIASALLVVAVIGKLAASWGAVGTPGDRWIIGLGMLPRGEVGLIFATIGLQRGILDDPLFAALLLVVLATTLMTPPLLRRRLEKVRDTTSQIEPDAMPDLGWLWVDDGVVDLAAEPSENELLTIALEAAGAVTGGARPGTRLLDRLSRASQGEAVWTPAATELLVDLIAHGNERTWRFLETTGVLKRSLPELANTVERRRADPFLIEPSHVLRFELVDRVGTQVKIDSFARAAYAHLTHPERVLLSALVLEAAGEDKSAELLARNLVGRLGLGHEAEDAVAGLVVDAALLRAVAGRVDGLTEESVLQLASHIERSETAWSLYLLGLALGDLDPPQRSRLEELTSLVVAMIEHSALAGTAVRDLVNQRRDEAMRLVAEEPQLKNRIRHAPRSIVLALDAAALARHAALIEPLPQRGTARATVSVLGASDFRVEVASRDRPGLLATVTGVLADEGLDVNDALVVTWGDGGAIESFQIGLKRDSESPAATRLVGLVEAAFDRPLSAPPNPDAEVRFDDAGSPWYTQCEIRCVDRAGLLHHVAVALASAGASVHSAQVETVGGTAIDRFQLTDANGAKLGREHKELVRAAVLGGVVPRKKRFGRGFAL